MEDKRMGGGTMLMNCNFCGKSMLSGEFTKHQISGECSRLQQIHMLKAENEWLSQELNGANEMCGGLQAIRERLEAKNERLGAEIAEREIEKTVDDMAVLGYRELVPKLETKVKRLKKVLKIAYKAYKDKCIGKKYTVKQIARVHRLCKQALKDKP